MDELNVKATKSSPSIIYYPAKNLLEIKGYSYPKDATAFYKTLIDWLKTHTAQLTAAFAVNFQLVFLNTSSSKYILSILDLLEKEYKENKEITVNWYYNTQNEIALACGNYFKEMRTLPFNLLETDEILE